MCGIVGYNGINSALPRLLEGLARLEYRGYDSAGVSLALDTGLATYKTRGRLSSLKALLEKEKPPETKLGIGHTRWATHGEPSTINAHPHLDSRGRIAVVHNGIIENYVSLREELEGLGHVFKSETDTEVIPHLLEEELKSDADWLEVIRRTLSKLRGSYALAILNQDRPGELIGARMGSPLVLGLGEDEYFLCSDIPAFLHRTRKAITLEDGQIAQITRQGLALWDLEGREVEQKAFTVAWDPIAAEKGGFEDFMLKEIHEQPQAVLDTMRGRITPEGRVELGELKFPAEFLRKLQRIYIVACGTAYHAGLVGKKMIESLSGIPVEVDLASEFRYRDPLLAPNCLTIAISQSGETADTLAALLEAKARGSELMAVCNVVGSTIAREASRVLYTWAGPEIAVASTKAYLTQLVALYLLALDLGFRRGRLNGNQVAAATENLRQLPDAIKKMLTGDKELKDLAADLAGRDDIFYIGRGLDQAVAMEGQLKLKEISYIHAEAYAAGELKHGALALIAEKVPVIALATQPALVEKMLSNIREVKARGAFVIAVTDRQQKQIAEASDYSLFIPKVDPLIAPLVAVIPMQLLAYYVAKIKGCDVDKPRNLAKSVTVE